MQISRATSTTPPSSSSTAPSPRQGSMVSHGSSAGQGTQAHFSPQGLKLAASGVDKLASAARLTAQGLGDIGAATAGGVGHMAHETSEAVSHGIETVQNAVRSSVNGVAAVIDAGAEKVGEVIDSAASVAAVAGLLGVAMVAG